MDIPVLGPFKMTFDQTVAPGFLKAEEKSDHRKRFSLRRLSGLENPHYPYPEVSTKKAYQSCARAQPKM